MTQIICNIFEARTLVNISKCNPLGHSLKHLIYLTTKNVSFYLLLKLTLTDKTEV